MKKIAYAAAMTLALAACSSKKDNEQLLPLNFAPAASSFVLGNQEPIPDSAYERYKQLSDILVPGLVETATRAMAQLDTSNAQDQKVKSVLELLRDRLSTGVDSIGINTRGHAALYEINAQPIFRIELADTQKFKTFIADLEQKSQKSLPIQKVGEQEFWSLPLTKKTDSSAPEVNLLLATVDTHAVIALHAPASGTKIEALLGLEKPASSILQSDEWGAINKEYSYQPYGTLLIKPQRLVEQVIGTPGKDSWVSAMNVKLAQLSDICRTEISAIASKAPRIVAGYTTLENQTFETKTVVELEKTLAQSLQPIAVPVPGVGTTNGRGLDIGLGIDLNKLAGVISTQAQAINTAPFQCEVLSDLNDGARAAPSALSSLYMIAGFVNGLRLNMANIDSENMAGNGTLIVASPDPTGLLGMLQGFLPNLANLDSTAGAAPQQIGSDILGAVGGNTDTPLWFAASDKALGFSLGEDGSKMLSTDLAAALPQTAPFLAINATGALYAKLNELGEDEETNAEQREVLEPLDGALNSFYQQIDNDSSQFYFSEKGLEIHQKTSFK